MEAQYWHQKWKDDKIGFHQSEVNKVLQTHWSRVVQLPAGNNQSNEACVLVPLCGKSLDMLWLHQQGHQVLGVELSEKAAQAFFNENGLSFVEQIEGGFVRFAGTGKATGIAILAGDFFELSAAHAASCTLFYDRAAMIAMNEDLRARYADHLATLMPTGSQGLLITMAYDQSRMQGPPFSVSDDNVHQLLSGGFNIEELQRQLGPDRVGNLGARGVETIDERVYLLDRK